MEAQNIFNMKKFFDFLMRVLMIACLSLAVGCSDDDDDGNGSSNNTTPDPEGTMVTNIRNDQRQSYVGIYYGTTNVGIGSLLMNASNIFDDFNGYFESSYYSREFDIAYIGIVNGLGSIKSLPKESLFTTNGCAALEGGGYVLRGIEGNNQGKYARLYVTRFLTSGSGIVGAEIKYQYPFEP